MLRSLIWLLREREDNEAVIPVDQLNNTIGQVTIQVRENEDDSKSVVIAAEDPA